MHSLTSAEGAGGPLGGSVGGGGGPGGLADSQLRESRAFGELFAKDWQADRLLKPSAIKPVLATFEQALIIKTSAGSPQAISRPYADIAALLG
jgi:hypothetical protein